ncbi:MAG TPA: hypothetical protein VGH16_02760 [Candidatus Binatia bacterium]|jgi:hypothetical protein
MAYEYQPWTIVLRCYRCQGKFTVTDVSFSKVAALPLVTPCPHCRARPFVSAREDESRVHRVFDLRRRGHADAA